MCEISSGNLFLSEHPTHPWATKWFERVGVKFAIPKPSVEEDISDFRGWWAMIFCMCSSLVFIHKHPTKLDYTFHVFWPWTGFSDGSDQWGRIEWTRGRKGKKKGLEKNNTNFQRGGQWTFVLFFKKKKNLQISPMAGWFGLTSLDYNIFKTLRHRLKKKILKIF